MNDIRPVAEVGAQRPLCVVRIRIAEGQKTYEALRQIDRRKRLGVPVDQCAARADFMVDGKPTCRTHASAAALAYVLEHRRIRTDAEEIANPRCICPTETVRRVIINHGTCSMGGCPYGGDI